MPVYRYRWGWSVPQVRWVTMIQQSQWGGSCYSGPQFKAWVIWKLSRGTRKSLNKANAEKGLLSNRTLQSEFWNFMVLFAYGKPVDIEVVYCILEIPIKNKHKKIWAINIIKWCLSLEEGHVIFCNYFWVGQQNLCPGNQGSGSCILRPLLCQMLWLTLQVSG